MGKGEFVKPYLFLDVDGVINPDFSNGSFRKREALGWKKTHITTPDDGKTWRVFYDPAMGARILKVAREFDAELAWATTWKDNANTFIAPLIGLPKLPVAPTYADTKAQDLMRWLPKGRKFTWLDDDYQVATSAFIQPPDHHVIWVDPRVGLTDKNLEHAGAWLSIQGERKVA